MFAVLIPRLSGLILITFPLLMAIVAPASENYLIELILKNCNNRMIIVIVGLILLVPLDKDTSIVIVLVSLALQGIGYGLFAKSKHQHYNEQCSSKRYSNGIKCSSYNEILINIKYWNINCDFAIMMGNVIIEPSNYPQLISCSQITLLIITVISALCYCLHIGYKSKDKLYF